MSSPARKTKPSPAKSSPRGEPSPQKHSPYDLNPTYSAVIPSFFSCQSPMQRGLMGIVITYLKQNNRYEALECFARRGSYKHMVAVCMGRDHATDFAKLSISVSPPNFLAPRYLTKYSISIFASMKTAEARKNI